MVTGSWPLVGVGVVGSLPAPSELICSPELAHADPLIRLALVLAMLAMWWVKNNNGNNGNNNPPPAVVCGGGCNNAPTAQVKGA